jgi:hypothetical protein
VSLPQWAVSLGTIFRHQIGLERGAYCWLANKSIDYTTTNWNALSLAVQGKQVPMWDYIKHHMNSGTSLQMFIDHLSMFLAKDYFKAAHPDEDVINYLIRTNGGRL